MSGRSGSRSDSSSSPNPATSPSPYFDNPVSPVTAAESPKPSPTKPNRQLSSVGINMGSASPLQRRIVNNDRSSSQTMKDKVHTFTHTPFGGSGDRRGRSQSEFDKNDKHGDSGPTTTTFVDTRKISTSGQSRKASSSNNNRSKDKKKRGVARKASSKSNHPKRRFKSGADLKQALLAAADQKQLTLETLKNGQINSSSAQPDGCATLGALGYLLGKLVLSERFRSTKHDTLRSLKLSAVRGGEGISELYECDVDNITRSGRNITLLPKMEVKLGCLVRMDIANIAIKWSLNHQYSTK